MRRRNLRTFFDPGKGGVGGFRRKKGATFGICETCGAKQAVAPNAWFRAGRVTCQKCGGHLTPSNVTRQRLHLGIAAVPKSKRHCICCGATLRLGNPNLFCSIIECQRAKNTLLNFLYNDPTGKKRKPSVSEAHIERIKWVGRDADKRLDLGVVCWLDNELGRDRRTRYDVKLKPFKGTLTNYSPLELIWKGPFPTPTFKPLSEKEAAAAYETAPAVPTSPKRIDEIVEYATSGSQKATALPQEKVEAAIDNLRSDLRKQARRWFHRTIKDPKKKRGRKPYPYRFGSEAFSLRHPDLAEYAVTPEQREFMYSLKQAGCSFREIEEIMHLKPNNGNDAMRCIQRHCTVNQENNATVMLLTELAKKFVRSKKSRKNIRRQINAVLDMIEGDSFMKEVFSPDLRRIEKKKTS